MKSYQNMALLQNLYRLKSLGFDYCDPVIVNQTDNAAALPDNLEALRRLIAECHLCDLGKSRRQSMAGFGAPGAEIMFIDAYVSLAEDESGSYYSGRSGETLSKMITNVLNLPREAVYLTHAVKCKAAGINKPSDSECNSCQPYWRKEIDLVKPKVLVALGPDAYRIVTGDETPFEQVRGHQIDFADTVLIPIYHPQFLVRNPSLKKETLTDLQSIKALV